MEYIPSFRDDLHVDIQPSFTDSYLAHHGIKGMHWGVRRYQNPDGTLTNAGKNRRDTTSRTKSGLTIDKRKLAAGLAVAGTVAGAAIIAKNANGPIKNPESIVESEFKNFNEQLTKQNRDYAELHRDCRKAFNGDWASIDSHTCSTNATILRAQSAAMRNVQDNILKNRFDKNSRLITRLNKSSDDVKARYDKSLRAQMNRTISDTNVWQDYADDFDSMAIELRKRGR